MSLLAAAVAADRGAAYELGRSLGGLAICALSARRGYVKVERLAQETGRLPRGWSPTTWSGICFVSLLIGHVWLASASGSARSAPRPQVDPVPVPSGPDPRFSWGPSEPVPEQPPVAPVLPTPVPVVVAVPPKPFAMNPLPLRSEAVLSEPLPVLDLPPEPSYDAPVAERVETTTTVAEEPRVEEPVVPPQAPRLATMDVLPAATSRKRR